MRLGEKKRLREQRILGITTGIPEYTPPVLGELRGFKLVFYNPSDVKLGQISTEVKEGIISDVDFELMGLGCGAFSFVINDYPSFDISYRTRVDIHPYFDDAPWFTGFIQTLPQPGKKRPYEYSGFGFFDQLDWVTVNETYPIQAIEDIVKDIIQNTVAPNTQIIYNPAKIEATGYTTQGVIDLYVSPAKKAIESLAALASGFEYGVDNDREFYFRPIDTDVYYDYWVGKHFQYIEITENPHKIRNRLYIKVGLIQGTGFGWVKEGSNVIGYEEDAGSIALYGLREVLVAAPEILSIADARIWAQQLLTKTSVPEIKAKIKNVLFDETKAKINAIGKVRITTDDGIEYEKKKKKAAYSMSPKGILGTLDLR